MDRKVFADYFRSVWQFLRHPAEFFQRPQASISWKMSLKVVVPPILIAAAAQALIDSSISSGVIRLIGYSLGTAAWTYGLRYVLLFFGYAKRVEDVLALVSCTATAFLVVWIPLFGPPLFAALVAFWTYLGFVHHYQMHKGAAIAAVTLPVVVAGLVGTFASFLILLLASLLTTVGH